MTISQLIERQNRDGARLVGRRTNAGARNTVVRQWNKKAERRLLTPKEMKTFRGSINSYLGIMSTCDSYKARRKLVQSLAPQLANRTAAPGYAKIVLRDYCAMGNGEAVPYFEFEKLRKLKRRDKTI